MELIFYSKLDCPLCDEGWSVAESVARRHRFALRKVDIAQDAALSERHRDRIPVLELDGEVLGWGRLSERAIEKALRARRA